MTDFPIDVDVVIVAHNAMASLPATLASVEAAGCPHSQIIVVDVASTDHTVPWLAETRPDVRVVRYPVNDGPSPGRNAGIRAAARPLVFLMDADVTTDPRTVQTLREAMRQDTRIAIGSPVVVHIDRPDTIQYAGTSLHFICEAVNPWLDRPLAARGTEPADIGVASTCALLIDRERALHYGLFDERYFIGKEDGDFTHRAKLAGFSIWEMPNALVRHRSRARSQWLFYFQIRNRWHFLLKNYEWRTLLVIAPVLLVHEVAQAIALVLKGHGATYVRAVVGLLRMLPALPADRAAVRRVRVRHDSAVLTADPLVVREDLTGTGLLRKALTLYERLLAAYWRAATRVLPG